jgi:hypothetical protein
MNGVSWVPRICGTEPFALKTSWRAYFLSRASTQIGGDALTTQRAQFASTTTA